MFTFLPSKPAGILEDGRINYSIFPILFLHQLQAYIIKADFSSCREEASCSIHQVLFILQN